MVQAPRLSLVAGETSGDLLAGLLLDGVRAKWPEFTAYGIGGPHMAQRGFDAWWPSERLAVRGYVEVLRHYLGILRIRNQLKARLLRERPDVFIGVDAPDFNLDLEAALRAAGIRTVHFVCPSIWAWRPERVEKIKRSVDHVLCIFPFEPALLAQHGIPASYVGHPLANVIPLEPDQAAARRALGLSEHGPVVALLPGSRGSEIQYIAPRFFDAAVLMKKARPGIRFVVPCVPAQRAAVEAVALASGLSVAGNAPDVLLLSGQSHAALAACDVTLIASGTATLEAALFKRPMVIAYAMNPLSLWLMRRKQLQPWVGLPNILCNGSVVPELIQDAASPAALAEATLAWLDDSPAGQQKTAALHQRFTALHHELRRDTGRLATEALEAVCARAGS
ncbi:MAG: lipid-A-disaccharide synthase [Pseudomonadota bacterium]